MSLKILEGDLLNSLEFLLVDLPDDIDVLVKAGFYKLANEYIDIHLKRNIPSILKDRLIFEKTRLEGLKVDYIYSYEEALSQGIERIKGFNKEELDFLLKERYADWILIEGQVMISGRFVENCIKVHKDIKERLFIKVPEDLSAKIRNKTIKDIIKEGSRSYSFHIKAGIKIDDAIGGNKYKVHLPIPKQAQQIENIKIISTNPEYKFISPPHFPQRTIYFESSVANKEFTVEYSYENHIKYNLLNADDVSDIQPKFYTNEWLPHIRFSPLLVELAKEIVGNESNALKKARSIYDYITKNVQYSFMRNYTGITSVAEYGAYNLKGDCGVQALLFVTLCRIVGIPARWQSGLYVDPHFNGAHDWAEFYIEPYGWLFADPSFGGGAFRRGELVNWEFYFGNLDPFRMVSCDEFHYPLYPNKNFLRNDPYDNQLGEAETDLCDLNGKWKKIIEVIEIREL